MGVTLPTAGRFFILQKKISGITVVAQPRTSCRSLFKLLEILPIPCQYILSLINFIINNQENFQTNSFIGLWNINTRNKHHLHRPDANLSCVHFMLASKFSIVYLVV